LISGLPQYQPVGILFMALDQTDVEKIAHLARIALTPEDVPVYAHNLSNIFDLVAQMQVVDTRAITPMAHPLDMCARLRSDEISESDQRASFQAIAPHTEAGLYLVPKVIE
jgi:aspartyl-tRNA(Asn)/glutamyl-tRNA(Gln) amidotransferase subunit C